MTSFKDNRAMRSALYMPGTNERAMEKGKNLNVDCLILDVEDAVLPERKAEARGLIAKTVNEGGFGPRRLLSRINPYGSDHIQADIEALATTKLDGFMIPKVMDAAHVREIADKIRSHRKGRPFEIWCMIENAKGVQAVDAIAAASPENAGLFLGPADLAKDLKLSRATMDTGMHYALSRILIAARAEGLVAMDGPFMDIKDREGLHAQASHRKALGFDGKALIHPAGLDVVNGVFGPSDAEVTQARRIIETFDAARQKGEGVTLLDGHMIEALHVEEAEELLARATWIEALSQ